jgi:cellulose synthase/poly-beta-1,6-N-acetylglucosamine synthase-like glycosyltransferase
VSESITVVVPVWDSYARFLPDCLASILSQDSADLRVLVVDNASATALPPLPADVDVVRLGRRASVGAARNAALARVSSPHVCFFDADDRMLDGMLARLAERLRNTPDAVGAVAPFLAWDPVSGETTSLDRMPRPIVYKVSRHQRLFALSSLVFNSFLVAGGLYRTAAVLDAGGFGNGNLGEDWLLAAGLAFRGRIEFCDTPGFVHRTEPGSLWFRSHSHDDLGDVYRALRNTIATDDGVPAWGRLAARLAQPVHALEIRRRTAGGSLEPRTAFET